MAWFLKYNFGVIFSILLSSTVLVSSLPTSVLVNTKEQQHEQPNTAALNKENHSENLKSSAPSSSVEHENPIMGERTLPKLHAQKRGVKQNFFEPPGMPSDILFNNAPGMWDDPESPYAEFQDLEDYPQYYQPPFSVPHHQQQQQQQPQQQQHPRPYENFQHIMSSDNLYDEPLALPVKYKYPTRFFDERRRKRGVNKNIMRLKRDSTKLNSADMLALLEFLEASQRNKHYGNEDLNSLEYQKPYGGPFGGNFAAAASNINNGDDGDDDGFDDGINDGEWWNGEWIEPSVQYYGGVRNHFTDENTRKRLTTLPVFPAKKRFMIAKKKRSLGLRHAMDGGAASVAMASKKSTLGSHFSATNDNHRA